MILYSASYNEKDPFELFNSTTFVTNRTQLKKDGCLILWGGEDVGTELYGEKPNKYCFSKAPSARDKRELELISAAITLDIPIIGICRGAQLLCVAAGGKLAQHIDNHGGTHEVTLLDEAGTVIKANSSHHQMMLPPDSAKVLAVSDETTGLDQYNRAVVHKVVNEVVYFPSVRGLGIQPHPEWSNCPRDFVDYCVRKIKEYLL